MTAACRRGYVLAVTGLALEARIARSRGVHAVASGGDAGRLAPLIEGEVSRGAAAIMSFGIAGGLSTHVAPGTWVIGRNVVTAAARTSADGAWVEALAGRLPGASLLDVAGSDAIVTTPDAKRALHASSGASIVDNESRVVAELAKAHGVPFAVFRVVSDPAGRALPAAAQVGLGADGEMDVRAVLRTLARSPAQVAPVARTALDAGIALHALLRGRRRLGAGLAYPDFDELLLDVA